MKHPESRAADMVHAIKGYPQNSLTFFPGKRFDPPRAGIIQIGFIFLDILGIEIYRMNLAEN